MPGTAFAELVRLRSRRLPLLSSPRAFAVMRRRLDRLSPLLWRPSSSVSVSLAEVCVFIIHALCGFVRVFFIVSVRVFVVSGTLRRCASYSLFVALRVCTRSPGLCGGARLIRCS